MDIGIAGRIGYAPSSIYEADNSDTMTTDKPSTSPAKRGPIIVARHGRPALDRTKGPRLGWAAYIDWWAAYEAGGLKDGQRAPEKLKSLVADADVYLTSSRLRAHQTIASAAPGKTAKELSLFDEAPLPPPRIKGLKMLPKRWNVASRIVWMLGHSLDGESVTEARARASEAALFLHTAAEEGKVFLAAHGWFNRMIRKELRRLGWRCRYNGGDRYWAWRRYEFPGD